MNHSFSFRWVTLTLVLFTFFSCSEKNEEFVTEPLSDYMLLEPGKYITYRVDSVVTTNFGVALTVRSSQIKHVVDAMITDNLGRPSYRIFKYIRNADDTGFWNPNGSYMVTALDNQVEVIENNLRILKLHAPLREGYNWKGNSYLHIDPYSSFGFNYSLYAYMKDWDYYYDTFEPSFTYGGNNYENVYTVEQENFVDNFPVTVPQAPGSKYRAMEKYAKNIGLVFREYTLLEYEPNTSGPNPYYTGFGVTMWMIDHN